MTRIPAQHYSFLVLEIMMEAILTPTEHHNSKRLWPGFLEHYAEWDPRDKISNVEHKDSYIVSLAFKIQLFFHSLNFGISDVTAIDEADEVEQPENRQDF
jgi:hypothetical protein